MGNGPGNIKEYVDAFYQYPTLQGGFAWEWANHGLVTKDKDTSEEYMAYGGDFDEEVHDGTFVMDGKFQCTVHQHASTERLQDWSTRIIRPMQD
jgi:beta-galactosidase/beta-glucuronidase